MSTEIAKKNDIRSMIASDTFKNQVALSLPSHMKPDRFARVALTALTRTPKLMDCTRESLLRCMMDCSQLGLEPDGRHAHLIPYKDTCTLIIDYKGLMALARRSGDVAVWRAELVKQADTFSWHNGRVDHDVNWRADRGKTDAVYSYVKFKDGNEDWEVMTIAEVQAIQKRSRAGTSGPWVTDFDEMAKKTAIRRHSKRLTLSPEFAEALEKDDDSIDERAVSGREIRETVAVLPPPRKQRREEAPVPDFQLDDPRIPEKEVLRGKMEASGLSWADVAQWIADNGEVAGKSVDDTDDLVIARAIKNFNDIQQV